jgi:hypothetical protein
MSHWCPAISSLYVQSQQHIVWWSFMFSEYCNMNKLLPKTNW